VTFDGFLVLTEHGPETVNEVIEVLPRGAVGVVCQEATSAPLGQGTSQNGMLRNGEE
jgi:hypothetical protein